MPETEQEKITIQWREKRENLLKSTALCVSVYAHACVCAHVQYTCVCVCATDSEKDREAQYSR